MINFPEIIRAAEAATEPRAWMRRWAFNGETPAKARNANGRMAWPVRFRFVSVTEGKLFNDDEPLYAIACNNARQLALIGQAAAALVDALEKTPLVGHYILVEGYHAEIENLRAALAGEGP